MQFNGILIGSDDPARLIAYYTKVLGEPGYADEGYSTWMLGSGTVSIGAHSEVHGANAQPGRLIWNIETPDVQGEFARMKAAGAIVIREPYSFEGFPDFVDRDPGRSRRQLLPAHDAVRSGVDGELTQAARRGTHAARLSARRAAPSTPDKLVDPFAETRQVLVVVMGSALADPPGGFVARRLE